MRPSPTYRIAKAMVTTGMVAVLLAGCASPRVATDPTHTSAIGGQTSIEALTARYRANPRDKGTIIAYAAALRAAGQSGQAAAALEQGITFFPGDVDIAVAYAKALSQEGRFDQALNILDQVIRLDAPDWNALLVKGAALDQLGRNGEARSIYTQAAVIAPGEASIQANLGLSYAMTNDLVQAERHLRQAVAMPGATSKIRMNLALILGLQGKFSEAEAIYRAELPADQVASNMAYVRGMLTQTNRWNAITPG